jgi:hypothetical protein
MLDELSRTLRHFPPATRVHIGLGDQGTPAPNGQSQCTICGVVSLRAAQITPLARPQCP